MGAEPGAALVQQLPWAGVAVLGPQPGTLYLLGGGWGGSVTVLPGGSTPAQPPAPTPGRTTPCIFQLQVPLSITSFWGPHHPGPAFLGNLSLHGPQNYCDGPTIKARGLDPEGAGGVWMSPGRQQTSASPPPCGSGVWVGMRDGAQSSPPPSLQGGARRLEIEGRQLEAPCLPPVLGCAPAKAGTEGAWHRAWHTVGCNKCGSGNEEDTVPFPDRSTPLPRNLERRLWP